jgi:quercetin dioxygenase-like cupin family protein
MDSDLVRRAAALTALALAMLAVSPKRAHAHCDTMDGPVVTAARRALDSRQVSHALVWVRPAGGPEIRRAFARTLEVRTLGARARELADRHFFEALVRVHRVGEGEPYTGLKPAGTDHGPAIAAADRALHAGSSREVEQLLMHAVRDGVRERFARAAAARALAPGDEEAGRAYVAAYVPFLHYVDGVYASAAGPGHGQESRTAAVPTPHGAAPTDQPSQEHVMSPVKHPVSGATLQFSLAHEIRTVREQLAAGGERTARTLVKDGPLRATLVGLGAGGSLKAHKADGPITVQVLDGAIAFEVAGQRWPLAVGSLFALDAGIVHSVTSEGGGVFLLTVVAAHGTASGDRH